MGNAVTNAAEIGKNAASAATAADWLSGIGSAGSAVANIASGIMGAIDSAHSQAQASRQAKRLKRDETANLNNYLDALNANDDEYLAALTGTDYSKYNDLSQYGYNADDYDADNYMDKEANYIVNQVIDEDTGKSALGGMGHSSGALNSAVAAGLAKSDELRRAARQDALAAKKDAFSEANTLRSNDIESQDKYLDALEAVMNRNDDISSANYSGTSSINTNYRSMMANA